METQEKNIDQFVKGLLYCIQKHVEEQVMDVMVLDTTQKDLKGLLL